MLHNNIVEVIDALSSIGVGGYPSFWDIGAISKKDPYWLTSIVAPASPNWMQDPCEYLLFVSPSAKKLLDENPDRFIEWIKEKDEDYVQETEELVGEEYLILPKEIYFRNAFGDFPAMVFLHVPPDHDHNYMIHRRQMIRDRQEELMDKEI